MFEDERESAAALISADPAFAALEVSGTPIFAVMGEPLRIVYANAAATAVFGEGADGGRLLAAEPEGPGLAKVVERARHSPAPRLERVPLALGQSVQTVTILCRRIYDAGETPCFVIAALGLRPIALTVASSSPGAPHPLSIEFPPPPAADPMSDDETERLRRRLRERHGVTPPRFLWKTDAEDRFVEATHVLADVVGEKCADLLGRDVEEVSRALGLGPAFTAALASRKSWSGVTVDWPSEEPRCRAPTTLGAMPIYDGARRFLGFQGFGVLRLSEATPWPVAASESEPLPPRPAPEVQRSGSPTEFSGPNVVALRPVSAPSREPVEALSPAEQSAFDEIARTLGAAPAEAPPAHNSPRELIVHIARALEGGHGPAASPDEAARHAAALVDVLPVGVLVARGAQALYANRTLLDYLGYADLEALTADGGLARVFMGRFPARATDPVRAVEVKAQDGETLDVDAHLQTVDWAGGPATLISLRRQRAPGRVDAAAARMSNAEIARLAADNAILVACFEALREPAALLAGDGRVERANAAFAGILGEAPEACAGRELAGLLCDEESRRLRAFFGGVASGRGDEAASETETEISARGRRSGAAPFSLVLRHVGGAESARVLCLATRETAPEAAREAEAARQEAERASAAKTAFLARVSHEIRTPLGAILGFAEVMMEERFGPIGSERYTEYLKDVHASGTHVLSLVNDLLDLSKIESGKMELLVEEIDVNAVIGECVSIMQPQANQQRVIMRLSLAPRLPRIRADERSLRQILLNLLSNAVKFNEPGGQVIVSSAQTDAGYVVVRVKDTGIGMSDDEIEIALEPFRQVATSRNATGTGLGLPVTKALIEANHASFIIKSRKNEGTLIEVAFPPAQGLAAE